MSSLSSAGSGAAELGRWLRGRTISRVPSTLLSSCFGAGSARRGHVPRARRGRRRRCGIGEIDTVARSFARCAGVEEMGEIAPESRRWGRMGGGVAEIGKGRDRARRERE
jgi:hypothetical protein